MKKIIRILLYACVFLAALYGASRLYYGVTGGFTIGNISSTLAYDARWDTKPLSPQEKDVFNAILDQKFTYLGKGCQSYVFASDDGKYVLKFFKYQRFTPQLWLDYFAFIPAVDSYRLGKIDKKQKKLEAIFTSWKIAFEELRPETGLVYVHLNKTDDLNKTLTIVDKMGFEHHLNLDDMEFLIQKRAKMLCATLNQMMEAGKAEEAKGLLTRLVKLVLSEYERGLADNDHALMQNTGVFEGDPIHIDVGQFVHNEEIKKSEVANQELFNKTYKFRKWLHKHHPELAKHLEEQLLLTIGEQFHVMQPQLDKKK